MTAEFFLGIGVGLFTGLLAGAYLVYRLSKAVFKLTVAAVKETLQEEPNPWPPKD